MPLQISLKGFMDFSLEYFINKFEAIPEKNWIVGWYWGYTNESGYEKAYCVLGHCRYKIGKPSEEGNKLIKLFKDNNLCVMDVNDGRDEQFHQKTPKERILTALKGFQ